MSRTYVVDGYNLLFHLGLLERRDGACALERARERLLEHVRAALGDGAVTVVFDSTRNRRVVPAPEQYAGIEVRFSGAGDFADDLIEVLIAEAACPRELVIISNDHRIQEAARRRGARPWSCEAYLDHAECGGPARVRRVEPERPALTREEVRHWLQEFGELADDPAFRELFDPYPFGE